jgi:uncharacterized protein YfiM (DUF2279 family)
MHLALAFVLSFGAPPSVRLQDRAPDRWFGRDKWNHFAAAAVVQSVGYAAFHRGDTSRSAAMWRAAGVTATISLGKEVFDRASGRDFSVRDLVWDAAGAGTATITIIQATRK